MDRLFLASSSCSDTHRFMSNWIFVLLIVVVGVNGSGPFGLGDDDPDVAFIRGKPIYVKSCTEMDAFFEKYPSDLQQRFINLIDAGVPMGSILYNDLFYPSERTLLRSFLAELTGWLNESKEIHFFLMAYNQLSEAPRDIDGVMELAKYFIPPDVPYTCWSLLRYYGIVLQPEVGTPAALVTIHLPVSQGRIALGPLEYLPRMMQFLSAMNELRRLMEIGR
jgi:hypothetical protein